MLEVLLVRHGQTDWNRDRRVMGATPIGLNATGQAQIAALAARLRSVSIDAIHASPLRRTRESAALLGAGRDGLMITDTPAFAEIDYGDWVGQPFSAVETTPAFLQYLHQPSTLRIPGGERIVDTQRRAVAGIEQLCAQHPQGRVLVVSHADLIKAIIVHYVGAPLDHWHRYKIDNGSLTVLCVHAGQGVILGLNLQDAWDRFFTVDATTPRGMV